MANLQALYRNIFGGEPTRDWLAYDEATDAWLLRRLNCEQDQGIVRVWDEWGADDSDYVPDEESEPSDDDSESSDDESEAANTDDDVMDTAS